MKYKLSYIDRLKEGTIEVLDESLLIGRLVHEALEYHLNGADQDSALELAIPKWLNEDCNIVGDGGSGDDDFMSLTLSTSTLVEYAQQVGKLYHRCSANYIEADAIRNNDGSVPKDPIEYPPSTIKSAMNRAGLYDTALALNNVATQLNPQFRRINLCSLVGRAAFYFYNFQVPDWVEETLSVEERFDECEVAWEYGKHWLGGIDWKFKTTEGALVICDHKTEKEPTSGLDVMMHPQLNLYAHLHYEHHGVLPDYLAIYHLPSGQLIVAQVDLERVAEVVEGLKLIEEEIQGAERSGIWRKPLAPAEFGSPCFRRDWKTKGLSAVCKYFKHCWPNYADNIEDELKVFENGN